MDSPDEKKKKKKSRVPRKRRVGRPPKNEDEKTVSSFNYPCRVEEQEAIQTGIKRLRDELGDILPVNRQLVIRLLLRRLRFELKSDSFSMVKTYLHGDE